MIIFAVTRNILNMVNQTADLLAPDYLIRAEQRAEAVPEGKVMLSNSRPPAPPVPDNSNQRGQVQLGYKRENKEVNCSLSKKKHVFPVAFDSFVFPSDL